MPVERVSVIGMGLIGSSIARAVHAFLPGVHVAATDRSEEVRRRVAELGIADSVHPSAAAAVKGANLVIIAVPLGAFAAVGEEIAPTLSAGAIVSDTGSAKGYVLQTLAPLLPKNIALVPAHPVAGTEDSGPDAGFAALFHNRWTILTPAPGTDPEAVRTVTEFWEALGAMVDTMPATHHDLVLAATSHIPHLIAYSIVGTAADLEVVTEKEVIKYSAGGFRDFTRIAASDPTMWRDIFLNNRQAVLEMLGRVTEDIAALQKAIRWGNGKMLYDRFARSRAVRRAIIEAGQDTDKPDFGRSDS